MKPFTVAIALSAAIVIGIFAYERLVVAPRAERARVAAEKTLAALEAKAAAVRQSAEQDIARAQNEVKLLTEGLEGSAKAIVGEAKAQLAQQVVGANRRALIGSALSAAGTFRVAVAEFYQSHGRLPDSNEQVGLDKSTAYADAAVKSISVGAGGVINIALSDTLVAQGLITFRPNIADGGSMMRWVCSSRSAEVEALLPANCR